MIDRGGYNVLIEVDGGIGTDNAVQTYRIRCECSGGRKFGFQF